MAASGHPNRVSAHSPTQQRVCNALVDIKRHPVHRYARWHGCVRRSCTYFKGNNLESRLRLRSGSGIGFRIPLTRQDDSRQTHRHVRYRARQTNDCEHGKAVLDNTHTRRGPRDFIRAARLTRRRARLGRRTRAALAQAIRQGRSKLARPYSSMPAHIR